MAWPRAAGLHVGDARGADGRALSPRSSVDLLEGLLRGARRGAQLRLSTPATADRGEPFQGHGGDGRGPPEAGQAVSSSRPDLPLAEALGDARYRLCRDSGVLP